MMGGRLGSAIPRVIRTTAFLVVLGLIAQYYFRRYQEANVLQEGSNVFLEFNITDETTSNATVWDVIRNNSRVSRFADAVGMFDDIVQGLSAPQGKFTIYAPINEAFEKEFFPPNLPWFYWKYLVGYHIGPGPVSAKALRSSGTVSSLVQADIFFTYKQRISTQVNNGKIMLNRKAAHLASTHESAAVNGYVHYLDSLLELPNSTASVLRQRPNLSTLHHGLLMSGLSDMVNDTNSHVGQTLFAPTNTAFEQLAPKAKQFLFGPSGRPYLRALLKGHIVANKTLFSDVYFPHGGAAMVDLVEASQDRAQLVQLPTLHTGLHLSASIRQSQEGRPQLWVVSRISRENSRGDDPVQVSAADTVVMDGVVHEIDALLLPPEPEPKHAGRDRRARVGLLNAIRWRRRQEVSVEELLERLGPWVTQPE